MSPSDTIVFHLGARAALTADVDTCTAPQVVWRSFLCVWSWITEEDALMSDEAQHDLLGMPVERFSTWSPSARCFSLAFNFTCFTFVVPFGSGVSFAWHVQTHPEKATT